MRCGPNRSGIAPAVTIKQQVDAFIRLRQIATDSAGAHVVILGKCHESVCDGGVFKIEVNEGVVHVNAC